MIVVFTGDDELDGNELTLDNYIGCSEPLKVSVLSDFFHFILMNWSLSVSKRCIMMCRSLTVI